MERGIVEEVIMDNGASFCSEVLREQKLFTQLFYLIDEDSPEHCQMELIEQQADMGTKRKYSENSLLDFYKLCV